MMSGEKPICNINNDNVNGNYLMGCYLHRVPGNLFWISLSFKVCVKFLHSTGILGIFFYFCSATEASVVVRGY